MSKAYIKRDLAVGKYYADVEGGGSGSGGASYSETESLTGGSWIDGSAIYTKSYSYDTQALAADSSTTIQSISDLDVDTPISIIASAKIAGTAVTFPYTGTASNIVFRIDGTDIKCYRQGSAVTLTDLVVSITYTKSE